MAASTEEKKADERGRIKERVATVVSDKMDKTVVLTVETLTQHPRYKKVIRRTRRMVAHDPKNECNIGDSVRVIETRPLSKTKRWRVAEVLRRAK